MYLTCEHLERCGFSGAIDPEQSETFTALDPEGQVVDGSLVGPRVTLGQVAHDLVSELRPLIRSTGSIL